MMDPTRGWQSIDAQQYPYPFTFAEFAYDDGSPSFIQRYYDFSAYSNVTNLWWRALPVSWPTAPVLAPR